MVRLASTLLGIALLGAGVVACAAANGDEPSGAAEAAVTSLDPQGSAEVAITDPAVLRDLQANGFGFGHHFGVADDAHGDTLAATAGWGSIAAAVTKNLQALHTGDPKLAVGMSHDHRQFDPAWLGSNRSRFELVAVTNRLDRATRALSNCGEVRFIYRLAYDDPRPGASSRMPMTVAVVIPQLAQPGERGCGPVANRWLTLTSKTGPALVQAAEAGPLASLPAATSFETNLQAVRWPSTARKDMGGEAEYMLNVWQPAKSGAYAAAALENTPDVAAINADPTKKAALVAWIKTAASEIDRGIVNLPEELAARTAYSYGPRGLARHANRPYATLVDAVNDIGDVDLSSAILAKSAAGLLRRLDERSCQGCHQARAMAGFHVLGNEDDDSTNDKLNRLAVGTSPHFNEEIAWRSRLLKAVSHGGAASVPKEPRPFAEHATSDGLVGQSCGIGADPTFVGWTCKAGFTCKDMVGDGAVGVCVPAAGPSAGDACEVDVVNFSADPHADTVTNVDPGVEACHAWNPSATCSGAAGGFPGGACAAPCTAMGEVTGEGICGTAPPDGFNACMIDGTKGFEECMSPPKLALRRACNAALPCRDDYACAYVPGAPKGTGACMPPYFIFEARVDGHQ